MKILSFLLFFVLFLHTVQAQETGNVGIGTSTPTQKLDVNGSVELPVTINSSTGVLFKGGSPFLHDFKASSSGSVGQNVFLGKNAGNFTMPGGASYQSSDNTGIGASTLFSNTTGFANTSIGSYAMPTNSTGYRNTAIGVYSLYSNLSGIENTSMGVYSAQNNSSGNSNVTIGFNANCFNQTGSNNTIIGYSAGRGTSLHNKSGNVFIGYQAGYFETGNNKLYIDNSNSSTPLIGGDFSLDQVYLNGTVGIGTSTPSASAKLEIAGTDKGFLPPRLTTAQIDAISGPATGLMVYNTTLNKPQFFDGTEWRNFDGTHYIGESFGGGIVFYTDGTGQHGLIASPTDQSAEATWGCWMTFIGATSTAIGSGQANTTAIENGCGESWIAAHICNNLVLNGYDDWFLPSLDELTEMYEQRNVIGAGNVYYWSSTEIDDYSAWAILFNGYVLYPVDKGSVTFVRAIRAF
jgi:hypothetical protein